MQNDTTFPQTYGEFVTVNLEKINVNIRRAYYECDEKTIQRKIEQQLELEVQTCFAQLFFRMESRRRYEEAATGKTLYFQFPCFNVIKGERVWEVALGIQIHEEKPGDGVYDENGNWIALEALRRQREARK